MITFLILAVLVLLAGGLWFGYRTLLAHLVFKPKKAFDASPADFGLNPIEVPFVSADSKRLFGWWFAHSVNGEEADDAIGTIIFCHGQTSNIADCLSLVADLQRLPVHVFVFDYRGYGRSKGIPTEKGVYADACAAFEVVRSEYDDMDEPPIILYGRSLGGPIAAKVALEKQVAGIVIENTFTSLHEIARKQNYPGWLLRIGLPYRFNTKAMLEACPVPVLLAHSRDDKVIPSEMSEALHRVTPTAEAFCATAGEHREVGWHAAPFFWDRFEDFVRRHLASRPVSRQVPYQAEQKEAQSAEA